MACFANKIKFLIPVLAVFVCYTFAGEGNINFHGQLGVHKTQSARTLGHGVLGLGFFLEGTNLGKLIDKACKEGTNDCSPPSDFIGGNAYPFLSLGLSDYFDFSISIPIYGEYFKVSEDNLSTPGWGDLHISAKVRAPLNDDLPFDLALLLGGFIGIGRTDYYGFWVHDPAFLNTKDLRYSNTYTNTGTRLKVGAAVTFDFKKMKVEIPLMLHLNGAYRISTSEDYANVSSFSAALELTPFQYISIFTEYYQDFIDLEQTKDVTTSTFSAGVSFHVSEKVDLQLGYQMRAGGDGRVNNLYFPREGGFNYNSSLIPQHTGFGGLTVKIFTIKPEVIADEEEYRNPDTDEDRVCDPWVAEAGRQREFARICKGIDLCPYEAGEKENKGCPIVKEATTAPTIFFTASPDVIQKGQSVTLSWQVNNATEVSIDGIGTVQASGSRKVKPEESTSYTLTAEGEGGTQTSTVEIEVEAGPLPIILFSINPTSIQTGQSATLSWQVTNATEVNIEGVGKVQVKGTRQVNPTEHTVYTLTAVGDGGTQTETVEVDVTAPPPIEARVNLQGVTFGSGNATLTPNAKKVLDGVAEQLLANPTVKIEIQGHTDNVGIPKSNQELSERRAKSVIGYLATKGVKMSRMSAVGYGQDVPIADNKTSEGRELNRRIEMIRVD